MGQFFGLVPYPFTAEKSTTLLVDDIGVVVDLSNEIANTTRANVLLVQNAGPEIIYFNYNDSASDAPAGSNVFPDGDQGILAGAIMTFPIAPSAGTSAIFYTLTNTSTVLISRG